jgi:hypothetical protein
MRCRDRGWRPNAVQGLERRSSNQATNDGLRGRFELRSWPCAEKRQPVVGLFSSQGRECGDGIGSDRAPRHRENVQSTIELFFGQSTVVDVTVLDDHLTNGLAFLKCLLGNRGRILVANVAVQRCDYRW